MSAGGSSTFVSRSWELEGAHDHELRLLDSLQPHPQQTVCPQSSPNPMQLVAST